MISSVKQAITTALVISHLAHITLASPTICYDGAGSYTDPYDCHNYIICENDGSGGYDLSLQRCPDAEVFDVDNTEGCISPSDEDSEILCDFAY